MTYRLLTTLRNKFDNLEDFEAALAELGVCAPRDVTEQFYFDHCQKSGFKQQYSRLDLNQLTWSIENWAATELITASIYFEFIKWVNTCAKRFDDNPDFSKAILHPKPVKDKWRSDGTWLRPPIFLDSYTLGPEQTELHLVEGHTRLGCLIGAIKHGLVPPDSFHIIWIGRY